MVLFSCFTSFICTLYAIMDRMNDLTYEMSRLDSDIADLQYQLSRQSTPLPGQISFRMDGHTRGHQYLGID